MKLFSNCLKTIGAGLGGAISSGLVNTARFAGRTVSSWQEPAVTIGGALYMKGLFYQNAPALITKGCVNFGKALAGRYVGAGLGKLLAPVIISYTMTPGAVVAAVAGGYIANKTMKSVASVLNYTINTLSAPKESKEKPANLQMSGIASLESSQELFLATVS